MTDADIEQAVRKVLAEQGRLAVGVDTLRLDDSLFDLGLDSQAVIRVMLGVEDALDITFSDEALKRDTFASIASIAAAVAESLA